MVDFKNVEDNAEEEGSVRDGNVVEVTDRNIDDDKSTYGST